MFLNYVIPALFILLVKKSSPTQCNDYFDLTQKPYFVDKSLLLEDYFTKEFKSLIADNEQKNDGNRDLNYYYVNSPRGFGKTTNLQMIRSFAEFEPSSVNFTMKPYVQTKAHQVFSKLKISSYPEIIERHMNKYGVILLDLDFGPDELSDETVAEKSFVAKLAKSFQSYGWLKDNELTSRAIHTVNEVIDGSIASIHIPRSLYYMGKVIDKYHPKGIILLIDNFDSAARAYVQRPNLAVKFLYNLIYKTIDRLLEINAYPRGNDDFNTRCLCLVTGITSLYFESINFKNHGSFKSAPFLTNGFFGLYFGFVQEDVDTLLGKYNCTSEEQTGVANYYRGYTAENTVLSLYNPISVIEFLKSKEIYGVGKFEPYWARNESIDFILQFAKAPLFRDKVKQLGTYNSFKVSSPFKYIDPNMFISFLESNSRSYEEMLDEDVPALLHYFYDHGFLKHSTKFAWRAFAFATFEVKTEIKRRLEEKGWKWIFEKQDDD